MRVTATDDRTLHAGRKLVMLRNIRSAAGVMAMLMAAAAQASEEREQRPVHANRDEVAALRKQVDQLEERVATLERLLLSRIIDASPDDRDQLQSELQLARERHDHTKRLFDKGYVSKLELMSTEYGVERAELRLELATMAADQAEFAASMQLFEAQANLDLALQRLETSSHLAARGFITQTQLRSDQIDADRARQMVDAMRARLQQKSNRDEEDAAGNSDQDN